MTAKIPDGGPLVIGTRAYYDMWRTSMVEDTEVTPAEFDALDADAVTAWMLAYASTLETAVHTAEAVRLTLGSDWP